ncbi:hypothetical protein Lal_00040313 [Lupinus albus]|uniref:tRNA pseudouridine(55) synthase n=1 Tax=Lupinus albus TaxID=3870 RepID=A0A6A5MVN6_LUPAL|nr:putative tRNA pseudouridine(55) synthase [Lupinus albus]KAF1877597.1 hypothetical protein Lal_00040313 [Lupinus albus]
MAKSISLTYHLSRLISSSSSSSTTTITTLTLLSQSQFHFPSRIFSFRPLSTTTTPYPLQYDLIINHPPPQTPRPPPVRSNSSNNNAFSEPDEPELRLDSWVDRKLAEPGSQLEKGKRKYYNKRRKRMYGGSDSDEDGNRRMDDEMIELKPEVIEFPTLHKREEELHFYDAFSYPWEKEKHYKMVYQLEKKYFPDQCLDKAFLQPGQKQERSNVNDNENKAKKKEEDKKLVFFEGEKEKSDKDVSEKKVEDFFKGLKKKKVNNDSVVADGHVNGVGEPFFSSRRTGLPPIWDSPHGTVLLINKPKGWTSFTVCGKLRRLVEVKKVGHAGTLDPMATGLLIVCVGKATKLVDRYQGMVKGYSGVFRLGEATSTWDADSSVIQREPWEHIKDEDIKKNASSFCGEIWQVPPMFSAIKVGGEKMYEKARRGESIELSPRRISIFQFDIERSLDDRQNLIFRVTCSKGTYIRSLCADFGKTLGSCSHLTALRRDSIGQYLADDAWEFQELEEAITKSYV